MCRATRPSTSLKSPTNRQKENRYMSNYEGKIITPKARIAFANQLFEPKAPKGGGKVKFGCTLIFDAEARATPEFKNMLKVAGELARNERKDWDGTKFDELHKAMKIKMPFLKGNENVDDGGAVREGFADTLFIRSTSLMQPQLVDQKLQPIVEARQLYSGCYVRASLGAFTYSVDGNKGVSFGLRNVQLLSDGPPLGGGFSKASDDFTPVEGGAATGGLGFDEEIPF